MAKAINDEELILRKRARRRLVGAIALVLIVVVFLPMVLDNEPKPLSQDVEINIPPIPPEPAVSSLPAPRVEPEAAAPPVLEPVPSTALPAEPSVQSAPKPAAPKPAAPKAADSQAAASQPDAESFVVQLGAFSNAGNAKQLAAKVRSSRFKAYTEVVNTANGDRTRVRVGPYPSREAAEKARTRLKAQKLTMGEPSILRADE